MRWPEFYDILDPNHYVFNLYTIGPLTVGVLVFVLGIAVLVKERTSQASFAFLLFSLSVFIWLFSYAAMTAALSEPVALWWAKVKNFGVTFIPAMTFIFTVTVIRRFRQFRNYVWTVLLLSFLFYGIATTTHLFTKGIDHYPWGYYPQYTLHNLWFIFFFAAMIILSVVLLALEYKHSESDVHKRRLKTFMIAFLIGSLASVDFLAAYGIPVYPFGYFPIMIFLVLAAQTVLRYRLLDITPSFAASEIVNTILDALVVFDHEGIIRFTNQAAVELFESHLVGKPVYAMKGGLLTKSQFRNIIQGLNLRGIEVSYQNRSGQNILLSISASAILDRSKKPAAIVCLARDISELRMSEEQSRLIIDTAYDAFIGMDSSGCVTDWNRQAKIIFGWSKEEILGKALAQTIIPERYREAHLKGLERFLRTGEGPVLNKRIEMTGVRKDGHEFPCELTIWAVQTKDSYRFNAFVHDIAQRKKAEEALLQKAAELAKINAEREQAELFAFAASHDLQEPLAKITAFGDLLKIQAGDKLEAKSKDYIDRMQAAAERMSQLIDALLRFSRVTTKDESFDEINLEKVVEEVIADLEHKIAESKSSIEIGGLPVIRGDWHQMYEVFQNLISNSIKFRRKDIPHQIKIFSKPSENGFMEISVVDNGIGFEQKYADKLFKPFERLHSRNEYEGSGMGLAICQKIMLRHGGSIHAESKLGEGATFTLKVPSI